MTKENEKKLIDLKIEIEGGVLTDIRFTNPKDNNKYKLVYELNDKDI